MAAPKKKTKVKKPAVKKTPAKKTAPAKKAAAKAKAKAKKPVKAKASAKAKPVAKAAARPAPKTSPKPAPKKATAALGEIVSPLDDRVIVALEEAGEKKTVSGLILVGAANEANLRGTVRAVGRGHLNKKGKIRPLDLQVGDEVLFPQHSGSKVQIAGEEFYILRESEVLGVVN